MLAIVNRAPMNIGEQIPHQHTDLSPSEDTPSSGIAGSYGKYGSSSFIFLWSICTTWGEPMAFLL